MIKAPDSACDEMPSLSLKVYKPLEIASLYLYLLFSIPTLPRLITYAGYTQYLPMMTGIYNLEESIWIIDQSRDTPGSSDPTSTRILSLFDLKDTVRSWRISLKIPEVPAAASPLGKLGAFAVEIGLVMYRHLLVSKRTICTPNVLIGPRRPVMPTTIQTSEP